MRPVADPTTPMQMSEERVVSVSAWLAVAMVALIGIEGLITVFWVLIRFGWSA